MTKMNKLMNPLFILAKFSHTKYQTKPCLCKIRFLIHSNAIKFDEMIWIH